MKIGKKTFGLLSSGKKVYLYTLKVGDISLSISTLGATWTCLTVPSRKMRDSDILLGHPSLDGYTHNMGFMGATIGRFGNRIGGAAFTLNGKTYNLYKNDGGVNSLHGGRKGFDKLLWKAESYEEKDGVFVRFELESPDGDEGFPGNLKAAVSYGLTKSNEVIADYQAKVSAPSPVNFTNHSYFNLAGEGNGNILSHRAKFYSSSYLKVDDKLIPTGVLVPVASTPFDFRTSKSIGEDIEKTGIGYDHCFVLDGEAGKLRPCAEFFEETSGRTMKVATTQPGFQFFTANTMKAFGKTGSLYGNYGGFCLETQHFPDSPNRSEFPSAIFGPDRDYHEKTLFSFDW
ncbi:aldose 1-epimerase [Spirochaetia bacterium]|nr:aldose 1-epimerase [Spirochaetia bacterium]